MPDKSNLFCKFVIMFDILCIFHEREFYQSFYKSNKGNVYNCFYCFNIAVVSKSYELKQNRKNEKSSFIF